MSKNEYDSSLLSDFDAYKLSVSKYTILSPEERKEFLVRIKNGDSEAREEFILRNLALVESIVDRDFNKYFNVNGVSKLDIIEWGTEGLIKAVDEFDITKGTEFSSYATPCIKNSIRSRLFGKNGLKLISLSYDDSKQVKKYTNVYSNLSSKLGRTPTMDEISLEMGVDKSTIEQIIKNMRARDIISFQSGYENSKGDSELTIEDTIKSDDPLPEEIAIEKNVNNSLPKEIRKLLENSNLSDNEKFILIHKMGLNGEIPKTFEEIGKLLGCTRQNVEQAMSAALRKIRHSKKALELSEYMDNPEKARQYAIDNSIEPRTRKSGAESGIRKSGAEPGIRKSGVSIKEKRLKELEDTVINSLNSQQDLEVTKEDEKEILNLYRDSRLNRLVTVLRENDFIIVLLAYGFIDGKRFPIHSIAEYLNISEEKVVSTLTKAYQFDIKYIDEALENIVGIEQQINIESEKKL